MRVSDWKKVVRKVLPQHDDWEFRQTLCYRLPVDWVLVGVLGEGSGFDRGVYVWRVVMPMFVPTNVVDLSWSGRVGGGAQKYEMEDTEALESAIRTALRKLPHQPLSIIKSTEAPHNRRVTEARAYAMILDDDVVGARKELALASAGSASTDWEAEIIERAKRMEGLLLHSGGVDAGRRQLGQWRDDTCGALGIQRSRRTAE